MTARISIASLVAAHNVLATSLGDVKLLRDKTSLNRAAISARIADLQARVDASTDTVSLVALCAAHNRNAKSIRARFRSLYADAANTLPRPVSAKGWEYRAADVPMILPHVTR
jgi:hypothetical protein